MGRTPHNKTALVAAHEWTEKDGVLVSAVNLVLSCAYRRLSWRILRVSEVENGFIHSINKGYCIY